VDDNGVIEEAKFKTYGSGLSQCRSPFILLWGNLIQNLPYM
jgi:NifU-like protein involved in Fe-S cluster formation